MFFLPLQRFDLFIFAPLCVETYISDAVASIRNRRITATAILSSPTNKNIDATFANAALYISAIYMFI